MATNSFFCLYHEVWREPPTVYTFIISSQIYQSTILFCFMTTWKRVSYSKTTLGKIYVQTSLIETFLLHSVGSWLLDINLEFIPSGYIFYIRYLPFLWQHTYTTCKHTIYTIFFCQKKNRRFKSVFFLLDGLLSQANEFHLHNLSWW